MNILYGIQGTGHGHISRARELLPEVSKYANVDVLISGTACQLTLGIPVKYQKHGISLSYDHNGGVSVLETLKGIKPVRFLYDVRSLPLKTYDLVISDYEPVSAWAAQIANIPSVTLSHQASFLTRNTPRPPKHSLIAEAILQHFAPAGHALGFHFKRYDAFIEPPVIRSEIRQLDPICGNHITVYLPAYSHQYLSSLFKRFRDVEWHVFSPACTRSQQSGNVRVCPISNTSFLKSLESCCGVLTSAGFETCAEAMFLGKKLLVVPIRKQYEQLCNAAALKEMGVTVIASLEKSAHRLRQWLKESRIISLDEVAEPPVVVRRVLEKVKGKDTAIASKETGVG